MNKRLNNSLAVAVLVTPLACIAAVYVGFKRLIKEYTETAADFEIDWSDENDDLDFELELMARLDGQWPSWGSYDEAAE